MKDWREDYVICEHIEENPKLPARHSSYRVCCVKCYENGFFWGFLEKHKVGRLSVGKIVAEKV